MTLPNWFKDQTTTRIAGKKRLWVCISTVLGVFLLYLSFRHVSLKEVMESLYAIKPFYVLLASLLVLIGLFLRTVRWHVILPSPKTIGVLQLFRYFLVGCMLNNTMPARLGEVTKAFIVGQRENVSKSMILATSVTERIFDLCSVLILFCIANFTLPTAGFFRKSALAVFMMLCLIMTLMVTAYFKRKHLLDFVGYLLKFFPGRIRTKVLQLTEAFLNGFEILSSQKNLLRASLISLGTWCLACVPLLVLFWGFHLPLTFSHAILLLSIISLGIMIPVTPGNIGTMQFVCTYVLVFLNVDKHTGFLFSVMYHAIQFIPTTLIGFYFLIRMRMELSGFKNLADGTTESSSHY